MDHPLFGNLLARAMSVFEPGPGTAVKVGTVAMVAAIVGLAAAARLARAVRSESYKRGTRIQNACKGRCRLSRDTSGSRSACIAIGGVKVAPLDETKHFKLVGTTGTGKSTAIAELLRGALQRGDRAIVADPDGGYLRRFHLQDRGDTVLNPFERASLKWDLFAEVRTAYDVDQLASGLIPTSEDPSGQEWRGYARTFLAALIRRCHVRGRHDVAELWRLLTVASMRELRSVVSGTPAQPFLEAENARMFGSIRSVASSAAAALEFVQAQRAPSFSIRRWVEKGGGVLFFPYQAQQIPALRSIIATWMRLAIFEAMSHPEQDQRLWFVVDELDALGAIDGLKDALARLRKFGGRCVLGFQSIAQVATTYGHGAAQTIVENCGNTLILRCSGSDTGGTAHFASRLIGEREVVRAQRSRGRDRDGWIGTKGQRRSLNVSEQQVTELAVLAAEVEQLPDLSGYLKLASASAWLRVTLAP